jgi:hypothetical protein
MVPRRPRSALRSFKFISGVLPEKARLDTAGAIKVNLRETCILLPIEFRVHLMQASSGSRSRRSASPRTRCAVVAEGEYVIKYKSPLNVLKDTYDHSWCLARSYEYNHLMTDSPWASVAGRDATPANLERVECRFLDAISRQVPAELSSTTVEWWVQILGAVLAPPRRSGP